MRFRATSEEPPDDFGMEVLEMPVMSPALRSLLDSIAGASPADGFSEEDLREFDRLEAECSNASQV